MTVLLRVAAALTVTYFTLLGRIADAGLLLVAWSGVEFVLWLIDLNAFGPRHGRRDVRRVRAAGVALRDDERNTA